MSVVAGPSRRVMTVLGIGALLVASAAAMVAFHFGQGSDDPQVLPPAHVRAEVGLCSHPLTYASDGNASPLFCPDGELNRLAWEYFADLNLLVMAIGPKATPSDVESAVASDLNNSRSVECSAYQLADVYYGWKFAVDPTSRVFVGGCPLGQG